MSLEVHIEKRFGDFHLHMDMKTEGGIVGILGASGCGKSLTLRCIAGIEKPDSGSIILDGRTLYDSKRKINLPPQQRKVGYLFQNYALFPNMTVKQNILCGLHSQHDNAIRQSEYDHMIDMLMLHGLEDHKPSQLSGGQAQRVALARILVSKPDILLLDEPFAALDTHLRLKLQFELLELLRSYGKDVLIVTHSRDEAYRLSDHIAVADEGHILAIKKTKELFSDPGSIKAAILTGCKNIVDAEKSGDHEVYIPSWNIHLTTALPVRDDITAIGIRAHYFGTKTGTNNYPIRYVDELEEPFEWIMKFRYEHQADDTPEIWWRIPKDRKPQEYPTVLGIAPANVLPLYPPEA